MPDGQMPATPAEAPQFHDHESGRPYEGFPVPKACPFCGEVTFGGIVEVDCGTDLDPRLTYHVQCDTCGAEGSCAASPREAAERWNRRQRAPAVEDLPRLSDEDREALESGYVALEGVQSSEPPQPLQLIRRLEITNSLDLGLAVQALKQLCELADACDRDSVPLDLLECVLRQLEHAEHAIERLCVEGLRDFGPSAEERRAIIEAAAPPVEAPQFHDHESGRPYEGFPVPNACPFCGETGVPASSEPEQRDGSSVIDQIDEVNGLEIGKACDALCRYLKLHGQESDQLLQCILDSLQAAKNHIEELCSDSASSRPEGES